MARPYNPKQSYRAEFDVRVWDDLADLVTDSDPNGLLWPVVGPRRSGKTWALRGLLHELGEERAQYLDLGRQRDLRRARQSMGEAKVVLLDEPGKFLFAPGEIGHGQARAPVVSEIKAFFDWCDKARKEDYRLLIAMTPAEWSALCMVGRDERLVSDKDLQLRLRPLSLEQAHAIARDDPARALLRRVGAHAPDWLRNPFLVRLLLDTAHQGGHLNEELATLDLGDLLSRVRDSANSLSNADYVEMVLYEGLAEAHQRTLRAIARDQAGDADAPALKLLRAAGLIGRRTDNAPESIRDPVVAAHLPPPLRIHHISDLHAGPKSAQRIHPQALGSASDRLTLGAGQGSIRESYSEHVEALTRRGAGPHLVIVSGDLSETGQDAEYAEARALLQGLELGEHPDLKARSPKVLLVGGNHDVDWTKTRGEAGARERHLRFADAFREFPRPHLEKAPEDRELTTVAYVNAGIEVALLGSAEFGGEIDELIVELVDTLSAKITTQADTHDADDAHETDAKDPKYSITAGMDLSSVDELQRLRDRLSRLDPGLVHKEDLRRLRAHAWRAPIRIAVLHHPVSPLPTSADIGPYAGLLNAGAVKDALIAGGVTVVLHGHMHSSFLAEERWAGRPHPLRIAAAPSLSSREISEHHGYNELVIHREGERYELELRAIIREGESWNRTSRRLGPFSIPST